ncbi:MAG: DUF1990 family protein [Rubrobacter sp.]|nr:DUF1990 family protein [Rubrobacter sp.]
MLSLLKPSNADIRGFLVRQREDGSVHYDLFSFARGNDLLVKAGYPVRRRLQKRFAEGSRRAMVRAVSGEPEY